MGGVGKWVRGFATAVGVAAVTVAMCEVVLRIYNPVDLPLRGTQIVLPSGKRLIFDNPVENSKLDAEIHVSYNSIGFRGPDPPADWSSVFSIVTVGGSTTHSARQSDGFDWPALVRDELDRTFENTWLNNAGLEGHSSLGHRYLLEQFLMELRPSMATFLVGANDMGHNRDHYDARHQAQEQSLVDRVIAESELLSTALVLWRVSRAHRMGLRHWELDLTQEAVVDPETEDRAEVLALHRSEYLEGFRERVTNLVRMCREAGIEPVLITQPSFYGDGIDPYTGVDVGPVSAANYSASLTREVLGLYNQATRDVGREGAALVIDLEAELPRDAAFFYDWIHFTNEGSVEVARIVGAHLAAHLSEDPRVLARGAVAGS